MGRVWEMKGEDSAPSPVIPDNGNELRKCHRGERGRRKHATAVGVIGDCGRPAAAAG